MKDFIRNKSGITLTALVVTIIIMIILAGVTLRLTIGDEGVISQSMNAKEEQTKSVYQELITVEVAAEKIAGTDDRETFLKNIQTRLEGKEEFEDASYEIKNGNTLVITTKEGYEYAIIGDKVILADGGNGSGGNGGGSGSTEIPEIKQEEISFKAQPSYWVNTGISLEIFSKKHPTLNVEYTDDPAQLTADTWTPYGGKISVDSNKTIYARLRNEAGPSKIYATREIKNIDKVAPVLTSQSFKSSDVTTKGFKVELEVKDEHSGLAQITWNYKLKGDTKWTKSVTDLYHNLHTADSGVTETVKKEHVFDKMKSGTYMVQANIYDVAGNITPTDPIEVVIGSIDDTLNDTTGGGSGIGSATYTPTGWTNESVTVTLPTIPEFETRYTTDGSVPNASSSKYQEGSPIIVTKNTRIYYIYTDGVNVSKYATKEVTNIDKDRIAIRTALKESNIKTNGFTLSVQVEDEPAMLAGRSGLAKIDWFYKLSTSTGPYAVVNDPYRPLNGEQPGERGKITKSTVLNNLSNGTYLVYVDIYDVAGNVTSTKETPLTVELGSMATLDDANASYNPPYWTDGDVEVTLTKAEGFSTKYTDDGSIPEVDNPNLKDYFEPFTVSQNTMVNYMYTDGTNRSNIGTKNINNIDKTPASVQNFASSGETTNSFTLSANIQDGESGIGKIAFYYKHQNDANYTEKVWSNPNRLALKQKPSTQAGEKGQITAQETFTKMKSGTYTCYIQVFNTAGTETSTISSPITVQLGEIIAIDTTKANANPTSWTNGDVTITLPTTDKFTTKYVKNGIPNANSGTNYNGPFTVDGNCTINYIYTDGTNINEAKSITVSNIDKTDPEVGAMAEGTKTTTSITVSLPVKDNASGIDKIEWYINKEGTWTSATDTYTRDAQGRGAAVGTQTTKSHTFSGLKQNTNYLFYAIIYDVAGNTTTVGSSASPAKTITTNIQNVTGISINPDGAQTKNIGDIFKITATVSPSDANNKSITWSSTNSGVATVDSSGNVRCVSAGTATITATAADGSSVKAELSLTVRNPINSLTLDKDQTTILKDGYTSTVTATTDPSNYDGANISWTIADTSIATVSVSGKTATIKSTSKIGQTTLTVSAGGITKTVNVSVVNFTTQTYSYTGTVQQVDLPAGTYKLEVWGAQGGSHTTKVANGGYGGYSTGTITTTDNSIIYVLVGGKGGLNNAGYNGGGSASGSKSLGGGGATHISTSAGVLSSLSSNKSAILLVAGGGGGAAGRYNDEQAYMLDGGQGGGFTGGSSSSFGNNDHGGTTGGTQTNGGSYSSGSCGTGSGGQAGSFGQGGKSTSIGSGGGGGGYWGGYGASGLNSCSGGYGPGGGGGSGYINTSKLANAFMYGYNVSTSSTASTKTYSTTNVSSTPTSNYAKSGDGAARITPIN